MSLVSLMLLSCAPAPLDTESTQAPRAHALARSGEISGAVYREPQVELQGGFDTDYAFGERLTGVGDLDGDGYGELLISDPGLGHRGYHWLFPGSATGPAAEHTLMIVGSFGMYTHPPQILSDDLDSDGYDDLVFGERDSVSVRWGSSAGVDESVDLDMEPPSTVGPEDGMVFCDVDGDSTAELIGVYRNGDLAVFETSASGVDDTPVIYAPSKVLTIDSLDCAGDVDGDGYEEVILGDYDLGYAELMGGSASGPSSAWTQASSSGVPKYGAQVVGLGDVDGDGYTDVAIGHKAYGYVELFLGSSAGLGSSPDQTYVGSLPGHAQTIAALGDVNGDGLDDLGLLELNYGSYGSSALGRVTLHLGASGGPSTTADDSYLGDPSVGIEALAGVGDLDGDGYDDIGIGAAGVFGGVLLGAASPALTLDYEWEPEDWDDDLGETLAGGDFDGDGYGDLAYTTDDSALGLSFGGSAGISDTPDDTLDPSDLGVSALDGVLYGPGDLDGDGYDELVAFTSTEALVLYGGSSLGASLETLTSAAPSYGPARRADSGDFNADGYADLAFNTGVGAGAGGVTAYLGSASGLGSAHLSVSGTTSGQQMGDDLAVADFDADGYDDLLVLADEYGTTLGTTGTALQLYTGSASGLSSSATLIDSGTYCGLLVAVGDVDGDGYPDALCAYRGSSTLIHGDASGVRVGSAGPAPADSALYTEDVVGLGDLNADGYADLGLLTRYTGHVEVFYGSSSGTGSSADLILDSGWIATLAVALADQDLDGDGLVDLVLAVPPSSLVRGHIQVFPGGTDSDGDGYVSDEDCDDTDASITLLSWYADADGDGLGDASEETVACTAPSGTVSDNTDCDDSDASVGMLTWYLDSDNDGYGVSTDTLDQCTEPYGYATVDGDCDDGDYRIHPAADEICESAGVDEDCDGLVNDDDTNLVGTTSAYTDADGDGYGDLHSRVEVCVVTSPLISIGLDCDDGDPAINPGAAEVCDPLDVDEDCDGKPDDRDTSATGQTAWYSDVDGDGYGNDDTEVFRCDSDRLISIGGDCNDIDPDIHPATEELCSGVGVDEDCDGTVDEASAADPATWYADADRDGYGDAAVTELACTPSVGFVGDDTDCDDGRSDVHPGAREVCDADGTDEDCDGLAENDDLDGADGVVAFYTDGDGDGYGDPATLEYACSAADGRVANADDCDDTRADVSPDGVEICDADDVDEDCDGLADDADLQGADGATRYYLDQDGDGHGSDHSDKLCDPSADWVSSSDDCNDADASVHPGAAEVLGDELDQDCDGYDVRQRGCTSVPGSSASFGVALLALALLRRRRRD